MVLTQVRARSLHLLKKRLPHASPVKLLLDGVAGDKDGALRVFRVGREGDFDDSGGGVSPGSDGAADSGGGGGGGGLSHLFGRLFRDVDS